MADDTTTDVNLLTIPYEFGPKLPRSTLQLKLQQIEQEINSRLSMIEQRLSKIESAGAQSSSTVQERQAELSNVQLEASKGEKECEASEGEKESEDTIPQIANLTHSTVHVQLEHNWEDSVWDISFFIGTPVMGTGASIAVAVCLLLNFCLLVAFILECHNSFSFPGFDEHSQSDFYIWRTKVAHDVRFRDFEGESLASGVCRERLYLQMGNRQLSMVQLLRTYLAPQQIFSMEFPSGVWLCSLALCVWLLTLTVELRKIMDVASAFSNIPFEPLTRFLPDSEDKSKMHIVSTSTCRRLFVAVISVLRLIVVISLGWYGILFLAYEVQLSNIILNSVALEIILNFDELLFAALIPKIPQATLGQIQPLKYGRKRKNWNSWGLFIMLALILLAIFVTIIEVRLQPFVQDLRDNLHALCGGDPSTYDFVVAVDAIGIPWAADTSISSSKPETYSQRTIAKAQSEECPLPVSPKQPQYRNNSGCFMQVFSADLLERFTRNLPEFQYPKDWALVSQKVSLEAVGWSGEAQVLGDKDFGDQPGTVYNYYLQHLLGVSGDVTCAQIPFERCTTQGSTQQSVVMRQLCPNRCGCASPTTGTVGNPYGRNVRFGFGGCASWNFRKQQFADTLKGLTCVDTTNYDDFASWAMGLGNAPSKTGGMLIDELLSVFSIGGCPDVIKVDLGDGEYSRICEETSLPALCPESCGCDPKLGWNPMQSIIHDFCPYSCNRTQPPCLTIKLNHTVATGKRGPRVGFACVFPFKYKGVTYHNCTAFDWVNLWCAVMVDAQGSSYRWGDCPDSC